QRVSDTEIAGYRHSRAWAQDQRLWFVVRFSRPIQAIDWLPAGSAAHADSLIGQEVAASLQFAPSDKPLIVKVGISAVDEQGARFNLESEAPGWDFDAIRSAADSTWEATLGAIVVEGGSPALRRTFYTALYHACLAPNLYSDADGRYRGRDLQVHTLPAGEAQYTVFSLWDTYRAAHPLFTLIQQERTRDFLSTMLRQYHEGGLLPVWELSANETNCMIGYHSVPVIVDAILKGQYRGDAMKYLEACVASASQHAHGIDTYQRQGFLSVEDEPESVSKTLEYAFDDWCIARLAGHLGQDSLEAVFDRRAQSWKNLFDPSTGFFRPRQNGGWYTPFDPSEVNFHYTEANAWQYGFYVPHETAGFMDFLGGPDSLVQRLDRLFQAPEQTTGREQADITGLIGQYAHGNEPSHHMAYLYALAGRPERGGEILGRIVRELYTDRPDGLCGNEDCGQMSAWLVFTAMGFYPLTPGTDEYVIGRPFFPKVSLFLENGKVFNITAGGLEEGEVVRRLEINGKRYRGTVLRHSQIMNGGSLRFTMGGEGQERKVDVPVDPRAGQPIIPAPFAMGGQRSFTDSTRLSLGVFYPGAAIHYTLDGREPGPASARYIDPIVLTESTILRMVALKGSLRSAVVSASYARVPAHLNVEYLSPYSPMYPANGDLTLVDGIRGGENFRTGFWQGFQEEDAVVVIDLGQVINLDSLSAGFLQDAGSWIWMPTEVSFSLSKDGKAFQPVCSVVNTVPERLQGGIVRHMGQRFTPRAARYVKVHATSLRRCPEWHPGFPYEGKAWVFMDEVVCLSADSG
ncbi:MAG TPA: GH92 family glycosyl hydrolase, partial [Bacteroidales bacterium]|nr:GH92 family glycosyl hydrolase [Bacteroidales bacterium]